MKYIQKQAEPLILTELKQKSNPDWQPSYADLRKDERNIIKQALMVEQGYICCYCEQRVTVENSHIEHFRPQRDRTVDALDFSNMLCSCQNQLKKGEPRHCGNLKEHWFDEDKIISPLDPHCETRFKFTADGYIEPRQTEDKATQTTIDKLGLDLPKLRDLRKKAIEPFLFDDISPDELQRFIQGYLSPSTSGEFSEFWTTINDVFGTEKFI